MLALMIKTTIEIDGFILGKSDDAFEVTY